MQRHGWTLLFHACVIEQLQKLQAAARRAQASEQADSNANVKLFRALSHLILDVVPGDPSRDEYRQGNTLGPAHRHWRRAKIGRRFRLFFRYDSKAKVIVYAWVNDEQTLRSSGSRSDPYAVFEKMLGRGHPPDDWSALLQASRQDWSPP
ncbi:type II toxin-antitoxin system YhaV family toxin [Aquincola tertiaricarbonis]|uniref:Type II toxin-antitoxin system YhaV family toxin n=1 Tax=Aquincola tertiaricarbonis TaxID=391953 RepID=A0ABY4SB50_AQUTE|nr:type II toxin-antitoxin system YhaV family toxin [Aquincola tertiaricarbonis]URI09132.1 type II toxin-antitoxin system YhaV family toxin [Aquincola tertiaricarbonis]